MAEFGSIVGAAVSQNYDQRIADLRYAEQERQRALASAEAKNKLFAQDLDFQNAANEFDNKLIKQNSMAMVKKIGQFARENPDYKYNPDKLVQLNMMKRELKDNPDLIRGLSSDTAFKQLNQDLQAVAKNPEQHDVDAYQNLLTQKQNYLQYGNQDGLEAAQKEGVKAFNYQKPRDFINLSETLLKAGNSINPSLVVKGKNLGEYTRTANPEHVKAVKDAVWKENGRQVQVEAQKLGLTTPQQVDKWLTNQIMAGVKTTYDPGDVNALFNRQMAERNYALAKGKLDAKKEASSNYTPFDDLTDPKKKAGLANSDAAVKTWGDHPKIIVTGNSNNIVDLTGMKMQYDGRYVTDGNGTKRLMGKVRVPIDVAYQKGMWNPEDPKDNLKEGEISSEFLGKAVRRTNDKGDLFLEVDYGLPIDPKDGASRQLYNTHTQPAKLVNPLQEEKPQTIEQNGFTYTYNPSTGQYE